MREIKFRAWDRMSKPYRLKSWEQLQAQYHLSQIFHNGKFDLMQYTGLKDKNGTEIYEGDIVSCYAGEHYHGVWEFKQCVTVEFGWTKSMWDMLQCDEVEVIGNIYENKELLND